MWKFQSESSLTGYIMVEQIKSVDYTSRNVKFVGKAPGAVLDEVLSLPRRLPI